MYVYFSTVSPPHAQGAKKEMPEKHSQFNNFHGPHNRQNIVQLCSTKDLALNEGERKKSSEYSYSLSNFEALQIHKESLIDLSSLPMKKYRLNRIPTNTA